MILKKPYALLIKNFRIIHIILTILLAYIAISSHKILSLFRTFINNNYSITVMENMSSNYISSFLYVAIILSLIILIAVFVLLKYKKKPNKVYLYSIIYYIIMIIFVVIASVLINGLNNQLWATATARTYRDICQMIYYPQYIFLIMIGIRALGFNVKKFNFKADLKELEITDADSEEIELSLNFQTFKLQRTLRRLKREFGYYLKENKLIVIVIFTVIALVVAVLSIKSYEKTTYTYKENQVFTYDSLSMNILESLVTNLDLKGNVINKDKYFVLLKVNVKNNTTKDKELNYNNLKVYYGNDYVYPSLDLGNYFQDFGDPYMGEKIKAKSENTYVIPYMIDNSYKNNKLTLNIYLGESTKSKEFLAKTLDVSLNPALVETVNTVRTANIGDDVSFASTALNNSTFKVKSVDITKRYEYSYDSCFKESCRTYKDVIVAETNHNVKQALVIMDYELKLDNTSSSYQNINDINAFASSFMQIKYTKNNLEYISKVKYITTKKLNDKMVLQTDENVLNADEVSLLITIRNRRYVIKLK